MKNITRLFVAALAVTLSLSGFLANSAADRLPKAPKALIATPSNIPQCPANDPNCKPVE